MPRALLAPKLARLAAGKAAEAADALARAYGHPGGLAGFARWIGTSEGVAAAWLALPGCGRPDPPRAATADARPEPQDGGCKLPSADVRAWRDWSAIPVAWFDAAFLDAIRAVESVCGLRVEPVADRARAHVAAYGARIDGPGNVLGRAWLPCGSPRYPLSLEMDSSERWEVYGRSMATDTLIHEILHNAGLEHEADPASIMFRAIHPTLRGFRPGDPCVPRLVARYGPPRVAVPVPIPAPTPAPEPTPWPAPAPAPAPEPPAEFTRLVTGKASITWRGSVCAGPDAGAEGDFYFVPRAKAGR